MYLRLLVDWEDRNLTPTQIAAKVMRFFRFYAMNRHKSTVLTPSVHLSGYVSLPIEMSCMVK